MKVNLIKRTHNNGIGLDATVHQGNPSKGKPHQCEQPFSEWLESGIDASTYDSCFHKLLCDNVFYGKTGLRPGLFLFV